MEEYIAHIKLHRDLVGDLAIAQGKYPSIPLDQALKQHVQAEVQVAAENQSIEGRIEVSHVEMPTFLGEKSAEEVAALESQVLTDLEFYGNVLMNDAPLGPDLRKEALEKYTALVTTHRKLLDRTMIHGRKVKISGESVTIPQAAYTEIKTLLSEQKKIAAIKKLREVTGLGLKESKDAIEDVSLWK